MQRCGRAECQELFEPRVGWQLYCTKHCGDIVRLARHRAKRARGAKESHGGVAAATGKPLASAGLPSGPPPLARPKMPWRPGA